MDKQLLPPKKMLGKNSPGLVERRRRELEVYLQTLLLRLLSSPTPPPLASFLHFDLYVRLSVCLSVMKDSYILLVTVHSVYLTPRLSVYLPACLSVCLSACLSVRRGVGSPPRWLRHCFTEVSFLLTFNFPGVIVSLLV